MSLSLLRVCCTLLAFAPGAGQSICVACSVPVFRYALEKWQPDNYEVLLFHRENLDSSQSALLKRLQAETLSHVPLLNMKLTVINPDMELPEEFAAAWKEHEQTPGPLLVVRTPLRHGVPKTVWSGPLTQENVDRLLDSPVRRQIAERILKGDSVVWILLEGGNAEQDDQAMRTLESELQRLAKSLKLPELAAEDVEALGIESGSVKLAFSSLRLSRNDPADQLLVDMLLRVEPDLMDAEYKGLPMAFPVFGRGRALHALVGAGISGELIEEACRFLTGACQCTVKAENPGVDLLMAVDWDGLVQPTLEKETTLPPLAGLTGFGAADTAASEAAAATPSQPAAGNDAAHTASSEVPQATPAAASDAELPGTAVALIETGHSTPPAPVAAAVPAASDFGRNALLIIVALGLVVLVASLLMRGTQA